MVASKARIAVAVGMAALAAVGLAIATQNGGSSKQAPQTYATAERGVVDTTVGGVGHVMTLTGSALLSVPSSSTSSATAAAGTPSTSSGATAAAGTSSTAGSPSGGSSVAPADAVFSTVAGHVSRLLVGQGDKITVGQPVARISDSGATVGTVLQAQSELATARLELAQKRTHDPLLGPPPTLAELRAGQGAIVNAKTLLRELVTSPLPAEVAAARSELSRTVAELHSSRASDGAITAAELAVTTAQRNLQTLTGPPNPADLSAAKVDVANALLAQESLLAGPTPAESAVAQLAVNAAQQKLNQITGIGEPAELATAQLDVANALLAQESLLEPTPAESAVAQLAVNAAQQKLNQITGIGEPAEMATAQLEVADALRAQQTLLAGPTSAESAAAQLTVSAAQRRLDQLIHPPPAAVSAAEGELVKTTADLQALLKTRNGPGLTAQRAAVAAARSRLAHLRPTESVFATAKSEVRRARADLAVLRQRGAPASAIEQSLARLRVVAGRQRLSLARLLARQLTVRARASGTVTSVLTTAGAAVDPTTPLMRVQKLGSLVVALELSEFDVAHVRVGELTRVSVDALGGRQVKGRVIDVSPTGTELGGVVNFPVTIALQTGDPGGTGVRPGMSVSAKIVTQIRRKALRIPAAAVSGGEQPSVLVRQPAGGLARRRIELGLESPTMVEVRSGLRAGERVLIPAGGGE